MLPTATVFKTSAHISKVSSDCNFSVNNAADSFFQKMRSAWQKAESRKSGSGSEWFDIGEMLIEKLIGKCTETVETSRTSREVKRD